MPLFVKSLIASIWWHLHSQDLKTDLCLFYVDTSFDWVNILTSRCCTILLHTSPKETYFDPTLENQKWYPSEAFMPCTVKDKPLEKVCLDLASREICRGHCDIMVVHPMNTSHFALVVSLYFLCVLCTLFLVLCNMLKRYSKSGVRCNISKSSNRRNILWLCVRRVSWVA